MVNKRFWLGILVMVLVFGIIVVGCEEEPEEEKYGAEFINGIWYVVEWIDGSIKTGTVITISNGGGILTSVGNDIYGDFVNQGLINIGDLVFRNIVYIGHEKDQIINTYKYIWSYDIWATDGDLGPGYGSPEWRNGHKLTYDTNGNYLFAPNDRNDSIAFILLKKQ